MAGGAEGDGKSRSSKREARPGKRGGTLSSCWLRSGKFGAHVGRRKGLSNLPMPASLRKLKATNCCAAAGLPLVEW